MMACHGTVVPAVRMKKRNTPNPWVELYAMRGDEKTRHSPWKQLALVGA
jgi:hypothetical protein